MVRKFYNKIIEIKAVSDATFSEFLIGCVKYTFLYLSSLVFKFDSWHKYPKEFRPYSLFAIKHINSLKSSNDDLVVEVGCGVGEIIRSVDFTNLMGFDVDQNVIRFARIYNHSKNIDFFVGGFECISGLNIRTLIVLNFTASFDSSTLKNWFKLVIKNNYIKFIIVDEVHSERYSYNHDFRSILSPLDFQVINVKSGFKSSRSILTFKNIN